MNEINKNRYGGELFSELFEFVKTVDYNEFQEIDKSSHNYYGYLYRIEAELNIDLLKTEKIGIYLNNLFRFIKNFQNIQIKVNIIKGGKCYTSMRNISFQLPQSSYPNLEYTNIIMLDLETLELLLEDSERGKNLIFANTLYTDIEKDYVQIMDCLCFDIYELKNKGKKWK